MQVPVNEFLYRRLAYIRPVTYIAVSTSVRAAVIENLIKIWESNTTVLWYKYTTTVRN